mgnify:FL=1
MYTHGKWICPNGAFFIRYHLDIHRLSKTLADTSIATSIFYFSEIGTTSNAYFEVTIKALPVALVVRYPAYSGPELRHEMPNLDRGDSFWLKMQCTSNAMEWYIDDQLVLSTGSIHGDSMIENLPLITYHQTTDSYYTIRDVHLTYSKYMLNTFFLNENKKHYVD